jgi:cardiolipin synthase
MTTELLLGADAFWNRLAGDIARAKHEVVVQMMTFEGDAAGLRLADALLASPAAKKRVIVDSYTRFVQSDRFLYTPGALLDPALRAEAASTRAMFAGLENAGTGVRFVNPAGPLFVHFPARNHKKLIVIDGHVAYIGGFNFSDHNFAWHDMMVRLDDAEVATFLLADFDATWSGAPVASVGRFANAHVFMLDGVTNEATFAGLIELLTSAKRSLHVVSPYLTFPFCDALSALPKRGVPVTIVTPRDNNKGVIRDYLLWDAHRYGFDVRLVPGMSHMKAALIDDDKLVVGSSNFDFLSYRIEEEIVAVLSAPEVVAAFKRDVLEPDLARSEAVTDAPDAFRGRLAYAALKTVDRLAVWSRALR